ncbi:hypothetical protein DSM25559_4840 [Agrobacterium rosae]|uniref:Uncharacterized protein n=1 Tax=Agrobacterium rosae TaxID=1972867 RepID=A0A1R3U3Q5_9HYPH|nr:hypothetical protein DSM25559_4840 [Agrobacterium rosae]
MSGQQKTDTISIIVREFVGYGIFHSAPKWVNLGSRITDGCVAGYDIAWRPFFWTTVNRRSAGPPGFLTPRSQSETRPLLTLR